MLAKRIHVFGRVQGVFYRASTKEKADSLGIKGWVQNEPDGSVLIEAEAEEEIIERFVEWCRQGPMMARVDRLDDEPINLKHYTDFSVRY